jgi:hypothetical protein
MISFYKRYYDNPQYEAIKNSELYKEKREKRYELEEKLELQMHVMEKNLFQLFDAYLNACADEQEILLEEMYLLGAGDREKMLKGILK